jgi:hypothetical protein
MLPHSVTTVSLAAHLKGKKAAFHSQTSKLQTNNTVACCLLPVACCLLPVACCLLPVACCPVALLPCCLLPCCLLPCCLLPCCPVACYHVARLPWCPGALVPGAWCLVPGAWCLVPTKRPYPVYNIQFILYYQ